jgi:hypothetical protein
VFRVRDVRENSMRSATQASVACAVCLVAGTVAVWAARPPSRPATRPASRPASSPATAEYPSRELQAECEKTAAELKGKLSRAFAIDVAAPFVVAGDFGAADVRRFTQGSVVKPAEVMTKSYFTKRPDKPVTILLFADANSYAVWAKKLFNDTELPHYGYFRPTERTMLMNIATGGGTLVHELTHSLISADFPAVPDWFNEGLGSLHEQCTIGDDRVTGLVNWRLPALKQAIEGGKLQSLESLLIGEKFYGAEQGIHYAHARYFCMYLQQKGLLEKFYRRLHDKPDGPRASVDAVEAVTGAKIADVEKAFLAWVKPLR